MKAEDPELLNNAFFQTSRIEMLKRGTGSSGMDHTIFHHSIFKSFACNDFQLIESFFPLHLQHKSPAVKLIELLYYKEEGSKQEIVDLAELFIGRKTKSKWDKQVVRYLLALLHGDAEQASALLQQLCVSYQQKKPPGSKLSVQLDKCFAVEIHGLYRFARCIDQDLFEQIQPPKHACFFQSFEEWNRENEYPLGQQFHYYPKELSFMNTILKAEIPKMQLISDPRNKSIRYSDGKQFAKELTRNVLKVED